VVTLPICLTIAAVCALISVFFGLKVGKTVGIVALAIVYFPVSFLVDRFFEARMQSIDELAAQILSDPSKGPHSALIQVYLAIFIPFVMLALFAIVARWALVSAGYVRETLIYSHFSIIASTAKQSHALY
jgi:O-antigen/teichoic acid export membrane protein